MYVGLLMSKSKVMVKHTAISGTCVPTYKEADISSHSFLGGGFIEFLVVIIPV